jgi:hypothetical protein
MALPVRKDPNGDVAVKVQRTRPLAEVTIQPCFAVKTNETCEDTQTSLLHWRVHPSFYFSTLSRTLLVSLIHRTASCFSLHSSHIL